MEGKFKCFHCGADNDRNSLSCVNCGARLVVAMLECIDPFENICAGTVFELLPHPYSIGRGTDNHIVISDSIVSRHHLELIFHQAEKYFEVQVLGMNRQDFEKESYRLFDGAVIPVGTGSFKFTYLDKGNL